MKTIWTDRSRVETFQRCARLRWLEYHESGTGIQPIRESLPLAVGGSVHKGLETLLSDGQYYYNIERPNETKFVPELEESAVAAALADFSTHKSALALDLAESTALAAAIDPKDSGFNAQLVATAAELGMSPDDPSLAELLSRQRNSAAEFDDWLYREQAALVEGMVRAYARRRLRPLLEEFAVLEVEREGDWELARLGDDKVESMGLADEPCPDCGSEHHRSCSCDAATIRFMSRPDALLRSRTDNSLYLLSFKTAASWDIRKARDAEHDMQGLSEGVEVEKRLGVWWTMFSGGHPWPDAVKYGCSEAMQRYLRDLPAPPRILGIRYEYLLKGSRYADKDLSTRFGLNVWAQRSHLIRAYANDDRSQWCWSYDFLKDDGSASKLYYKTWRPRAVWESMPIRQWIDLLDTATEAMSAYDSTTGAEPRPLGWHSDAQAQGFTPRHPLDECFPAPLLVYRQDDQLRDFVEQIEHQERKVAEAVSLVQIATDDGERRSLLNRHFSQTRRACEYPSSCPYIPVCFGASEMQNNPLDSGRYKRRIPNHPQEGCNNGAEVQSGGI
jgi:hypothetical protein